MDNYDARSAYRDPDVANTYDAQRFHSVRGRIGHWLDQRALRRSLRPLAKNRTLRLLDLPCGTGRITTFLIKSGHAATGADVSLDMLRAAHNKLGKRDRITGITMCDAEEIAFKSHSFDCVVSVRFMGHIPRPARVKMLKEFNRVASHAIVEYSVQSPITRLTRAILHRFAPTALPNSWGWTSFSWSELRDEIRHAGCRIVSTVPKIPWLSDSWYVLMKSQQEEGSKQDENTNR